MKCCKCGEDKQDGCKGIIGGKEKPFICIPCFHKRFVKVLNERG